MIVTPGSYRLGDWKLRFRRGGGATDHSISEAMLHDLSNDPAELSDLSSSNIETKSRLFSEYRAFVETRNLKPLAIRIAERKRLNQTQARQTRSATKSNGSKPGSRRIQIPENLSEARLTKVESLTKEYASEITELQMKLDNVLTDEQKEARRAGQKKALAEGLKGGKLRTAADAAAQMTDKHKKQTDDLRQAIAKLARERRARLKAIVTEKN